MRGPIFIVSTDRVTVKIIEFCYTQSTFLRMPLRCCTSFHHLKRTRKRNLRERGRLTRSRQT